MADAGQREPTLGLLTMSFAGDFDLCRMLVDSRRRMAPGVLHRIVVPAADVAMFSDLQDDCTEVVSSAEYLPPGVRRLPRAPRHLRSAVPKLRRDAFRYRGRLVRGWLMQQVLKLSASQAMPTEMVMHCDSDVFFLRAPEVDDYWIQGRPRLYSEPGAGQDRMHRKWHATAAVLLGMGDTRYFGEDWIGALIPWHRKSVQELLAVVADVSGVPWYRAVLGHHDLSEYILYGAFAQHSGRCSVQHWPDPQELAVQVWNEPLATEQQKSELVGRVSAAHLGGLIQSTHPIPADRRECLIRSLQQRAAALR